MLSSRYFLPDDSTVDDRLPAVFVFLTRTSGALLDPTLPPPFELRSLPAPSFPPLGKAAVNVVVVMFLHPAAFQ